MMYLTETHQIIKSNPIWNELDQLCEISKDLYNKSLYVIKQHYLINQTYKTNKGQIFTYTSLYHQLNNSNEFRPSKKTNTKCLKQVFFQMNYIFSSYFKALKSYNKDRSKFKSAPKVPVYKESNSRNVFTFPSDAISYKKDGYIHLSMTDILINTDQTKGVVKEVKIVPKVCYYNIEIIYEKQETEISSLPKKYLSIDLGINNLATITSNDLGIKPVLINGKPVKSINQYYNKKKSKLSYELEKGIDISKSIYKLIRKRNNKIKDYFHKSSKFIIDMAKNNEITHIVIGKNIGWKQKTNIGKRNNQSFQSIPYNILINQITYKAKLEGITIIFTEESYTSKCSFLDMENICKQEIYLGKRTKRGLFISSKNIKINADMNGSLNILRKVVGGDIFSKPIEDYAVSPIRMSINT